MVLVPDLGVKKRPLSLSTVAFSSLSDQVLLVAQNEKIHKLSENCSGVSVTSFVETTKPAADSILIPPTFPIASLNRTPNFSGEA